MLLIAPVAMASSESVHFNMPLTGYVSASDDEGDSLTASVALDPVHGSVTLNADGSYNYTPDSNFVGTDSFDFQVFDGADFSNVATVTISVTNASPTASGAGGSTEFNTPLMGFVSGADADGDLLSASVATDPLHGSVTMSSDGSFVYAPDIDFAGTDSFGFRFSDGPANSCRL
ncbi:MAG: cadherin-like domain-containing protein, partial [Planctomycetaceae bacterium]|nr:cadherin-like domain-containing protein [Planctomycetaceae bacterium]